MKIYAIRHGETDWNVEKRAQGQTDIELNENGIKQAVAAKELVQQLNPDVIISSPLKRAHKTAEIVADGKIKIILEDRLKERCFGDFEGTEIATMPWEEFYHCEKNLSNGNMETVLDLLKRVKNVLTEIKEKYSDKTVLIVTHGGTLRAINACINGIPESKTLAGQGFKNCEIREFNI
ncbi:MAG: histidine phosphatase family protein [Clostridiales bacterium]|nr:histidine phosphatase family protein [Clostridiales bacterium]